MAPRFVLGFVSLFVVLSSGFGCGGSLAGPAAPDAAIAFGEPRGVSPRPAAPPETLLACAGKPAGSSCSFPGDAGDGDIVRGTCATAPREETRLMCLRDEPLPRPSARR